MLFVRAGRRRDYPAVRLRRLTPTPPNSEKPLTLTFGAPGMPAPCASWSKPPITPRPAISTLTSGGSRMVCPPRIEYAWIYTSEEVKSA